MFSIIDSHSKTVMSSKKAIADRIWLFEKLGKFWKHEASRDLMLNSFSND